MDITVQRSVSAYRLHYPLTAKGGGGDVQVRTRHSKGVALPRDAVATQRNVF
jgi:hypothetical protein